MFSGDQESMDTEKLLIFVFVSGLIFKLYTNVM